MKTPDFYILLDETTLNEAIALDNTYDDVLNDLSMRVSNTDLSYRQINALDNDGLLPSSRASDKNWRIFSTKDAAYLAILADLKNFGVKNEALKNLYSGFYGTKSFKQLNLAFKAALSGTIITLVFKSDGSVGLMSPTYLDWYDSLLNNESEASEIRIVLNKILSTVTETKEGKRFYLSKTSVKDQANNNRLNEAEKIILEALRKQDYEEITVKKASGKPTVLYASTTIPVGVTPFDIVKLLKSNDFIDAEVKKRDGRVVYVKANTSIKL